MRVVIALVVILALVGCDDGGADDQPVETMMSIATTTTATPVTTTQATAPTTTEPVEAPDNGTESIGVTDEVTITITDPEDG